jgi:hypothetical protein
MPVPRPLTGSPTGTPINVATNAVPGTLIHTSAQGRFERTRLVVSNVNAAARVLTLIVSGAGATQQLEHSVAGDTTEELPDIPVADGQQIFAFGSVAADLRISGDTLPF